MERRIRAGRALDGAIQPLRENRADVRARLARIDWLVVPPARDTLGSSTTGEVVTAMMVAWARTLALWSVIACLALSAILLVRGIFGP